MSENAKPQDHVPWNIGPVQTIDGLVRTLQSAANGLRTQAIASPVLANDGLATIRARLSAIADELNGMQSDVLIADARKR
jgi:hypothetical protein